jgi:hypothetical protein
LWVILSRTLPNFLGEFAAPPLRPQLNFGAGGIARRLCQTNANQVEMVILGIS